MHLFLNVKKNFPPEEGRALSLELSTCPIGKELISLYSRKSRPYNGIAGRYCLKLSGIAWTKSRWHCTWRDRVETKFWTGDEDSTIDLLDVTSIFCGIDI